MSTEEEFFVALGAFAGAIITSIVLALTCMVVGNRPYSLIEDDNKFYEIKEVTEVEFRKLQITRLGREEINGM